MPRTRHPVDVWLLGTASIYLVIATLLYLGGGYHMGFLTINRWSTHIPAMWWQIITASGDEVFLLSALLLLDHKNSARLHVLFWAILGGFLISQTIKHGFVSLRPPLVLPGATFHLIGPSLKKMGFPSGHTQLAFAVAGSLLVFIPKPSGKIAVLGMASLVGISRVAVGVHWPIDVLVGAAVGLVAAWLGLWIVRQTNWNRRFDLRPLIILILLIFPLRLITGYDPGLEVPVVLAPLLGMLILTKVAQDYLWYASYSSPSA